MVFKRTQDDERSVLFLRIVAMIGIEVFEAQAINEKLNTRGRSIASGVEEQVELAEPGKFDIIRHI